MDSQSESSNNTDDLNVPAFCSICGDKATGKHYGANSCDGCKGFFRRSVRKNHHYTCTFNRNCVIDRDKRNQCRYCRLKKCFKSGMKKEAVQTERDKISNSRTSYEDYNSVQNYITMAQLQNAELQIAQERKPNPNKIRVNQLADLDDVCDSMKEQLLLLVNWAKSLACFVQLSLDDQIALLRGHAGEMLILGVVWRSLVQGLENSLVLGNSLIIAADSSEPDISDVALHILNLLFHPMKSLELEEVEIASFKAIIFFDPSTHYLSDSSRQHVRACRSQVQVELMNYMNDKQYSSQGRFGELMLLLSDLRSVTQLMVKKVHLAKMMGFAKIDSLLSETLLSSQESEHESIIYDSTNQHFHQPNNSRNQLSSSILGYNQAQLDMQTQNSAFYMPAPQIDKSFHTKSDNQHIIAELQQPTMETNSSFSNQHFQSNNPTYVNQPTKSMVGTNPHSGYTIITGRQFQTVSQTADYQSQDELYSHLSTNLYPSSFSPVSNYNSPSFIQ